VHFHNNAHHKFQNQKKSFSIIHGAAGNENVAADGRGAESHGIGEANSHLYLRTYLAIVRSADRFIIR